MRNSFDPLPITAYGIEVAARVSSRAEDLLEALNRLPNSREKLIALQKLEECSMWANKCVATHLR